MDYTSRPLAGLATAFALGVSPAAAQDQNDVAALRTALEAMRAAYEGEIAKLEGRINALEAQVAATKQTSPAQAVQAAPPPIPVGARPSRGNAFNPDIGVVFNGRYAAFKNDPENFTLPGFPLGGETGPGEEGFSLDETEVSLSANADDKFFASVTTAIDASDEGVELDLEEAFIQTLALPYGATVKAGRFFAALGYLNENHDHTDNFVDRPLPYQAFLADQYNDTGIQLAVTLPTDLYVQIGGGVFRGGDFPAAGGAHNGAGAYTGFLRLGGDIGFESSWRLGLSHLHASARDRVSGPEDGAPADLVAFDGNADLTILDAKYQWAPNGNARETSLTFQGEYMRRNESGLYNGQSVDLTSDGFYAEGVYKFARQWRTGYRFALIDPDRDVPAGLVGTVLDASGGNSRAHSVMLDWANSEFSLLRAQFSRERTGLGDDNRFFIQYILAIGAHGAHNF